MLSIGAAFSCIKAGDSMATIRTAIQIHDGMTPAFRSMSKALNMTLSSFESLQRASSNAIDTSSIQAARAELNQAETAFNAIEQQIKEANTEQEKFETGSNNIMSVIKRMAVTAGTVFSVKKIIDLSDSMTSINARLNLINDGLQTTDQLQNMIFKSAQDSRTLYLDTANVVSKLGILAGDAFSSNQEMIVFAEQMNKQFKIGGSSLQESQAAMYQLTQAMAAGRLQGDEFRSIMENAPMLAQAIAKYMGKTTGELREMSREGLITADVIKNAMFAAADETNRKFAELPMTFGQVATVVGNSLLKAFKPVIQFIGKGAQWIYDNWSILGPIFYGLAVAVGVYATAMGIQTAVTWLNVAANRALIKTLLANPLLWIAIAIGIVIAAIIAWVQSVGGLEVAWKIAMNGILTAWDWVKIGFMTGVYWIIDLWDNLNYKIAAISVSIQNFMGDMKTGVIMILQDMVNSGIRIINSFIDLLNKIPGVSIGAIAELTFGTNAKLANEASKQARAKDLAAYRAELDAAVAGRAGILNQMKLDARNATAQRQSEIDIAQAAALETASNTARMADSMEVASEELKYMRDLAEREAVNRFTTAEIKIDMSGMSNNISKETDLDGVINHLTEKLTEELQTCAEGVHA